MANQNPPSFYRLMEYDGSVDAPLFLRIPQDVWSGVFDAFLEDEFPTEPLLRGDSLIEPLVEWTRMSPPRGTSRTPICVPSPCCRTLRGARSKQTQKCTFTGTFQRLGLPALMHVDGYARTRLASYPDYVGLYRFIDPAPSKAKLVDRTTRLYSPIGLCLCGLVWTIERLHVSRDVELTFPSSNETYTRSTSSILKDHLLQHGAPHLRRLVLRFDWNSAYEADKTKTMLACENLEKALLLNATFLPYGRQLKMLHLGAEEDFLTWKPSDIFAVLRACPSLNDLKLLSILATPRGDWDSRSEQPVLLNDLTHMHVRDTLSRWSTIRHVLRCPNITHIHVDVIALQMGVSRTTELYATETLNIAEFAAQWCPKALLLARELAAGITYHRDRDENWVGGPHKLDNWIECGSVELGASPSVISDPQSHPTEHYFKFTQRSATTSLRAWSPSTRSSHAPDETPSELFTMIWETALYYLNEELETREITEHSVTSRIRDIRVKTDEFIPSCIDWRTLLTRRLPGLKVLRVLGIEYDGNGLTHLAVALNSHVGLDTPGDQLESIHLVDWNWVQAIPVSELNDVTRKGREGLAVQAKWY